MKSDILYLILGEGDINAVLIKTLAEAHANTNLKLDIVHEMFRKPQVRLITIYQTNMDWLSGLRLEISFPIS